ncbi:MAG: hypothetical protein ACRBBP_02615 [Bdellovibrionales bacterium]
MSNLTSELINEPVRESVTGFLQILFGEQQTTLFLILFLVIFLIQFGLVFLLYRSNRASAIKITDLESLLGITADRVLSIKERTDAVTYQDVMSRFKAGQKPYQIAEETNVSLKELEALERILKTID